MTEKDEDPNCPVPASRYEHVVLGHGSGGRLTADLLRTVFLPAFDGPILARLEDQALLPLSTAGGRVAFTTDTFVVSPLFFPGGDIGRLAVAGTVNDLAVGGARPLYLSAAFVIEEGTPLETLARIARSMAETCREANVEIVAGDTKVVEHGKGDGVFVTTSGVGIVPKGRDLSAHAARPGDRVVVSGSIGEHGVAILSVREGIAFETALTSDVAPIADLALAALEACPGVRCMRDPTRGGLASALTEIAEASRAGVELDEASIPLSPGVRAACELLGLDPLYVASEGRFVAVVAPEHTDALVAALRAHPKGRGAEVVGRIVAEHPGLVSLRSKFGGRRFVALHTGEQLPRIC